MSSKAAVYRGNKSFTVEEKTIEAPFVLTREVGKTLVERGFGRIIFTGRWDTPADFGGPVVFLASSAADYVHGEVLSVDGGWMGR